MGMISGDYAKRKRGQKIVSYDKGFVCIFGCRSPSFPEVSVTKSSMSKILGDLAYPRDFGDQAKVEREETGGANEEGQFFDASMIKSVGDVVGGIPKPYAHIQDIARIEIYIFVLASSHFNAIWPVTFGIVESMQRSG
jgi:hypothetical protein